MNQEEHRQQWAERTGEYSPEYYAYYGPNDTSELLGDLLTRYVGRDASVLELGCSAGRHLAHLLEEGFEDLAGVEINDDAREVIEDTYPELASTGTFHFEAIQSAVRSFDDDQFDAVYSVETLQHLPPEDSWVYDEIARVTSDLLVTVETESPSEEAEPARPGVNYVNDEFPLYYRDWKELFTPRGFEQVEVYERERDTVRAFRVQDAE